MIRYEILIPKILPFINFTLIDTRKYVIKILINTNKLDNKKYLIAFWFNWKYKSIKLKINWESVATRANNWYLKGKISNGLNKNNASQNIKHNKKEIIINVVKESIECKMGGINIDEIKIIENLNELFGYNDYIWGNNKRYGRFICNIWASIIT